MNNGKSNGQAKNVGIWIRVSTEDQAKGESPEHHEKRARYYADSKGWNVLEVYHLEAVSGKSVKEHPEAQRMLSDIKSGHVTGLIFSKLARLARNTKELLEFADFFRDHDADLISLQESIDTSSPSGRFFYTMIAAMAQWEREEIADRVAASVPIRAKLGKRLGGASPLGYQWVENKLVIDSKWAPIRKLVYDLFIEKRRIKVVARELNNRGYRTRVGKKFTHATVKRILRDPSAKGQYRANYTHTLGKGNKWEFKPETEWIYTEVEPIVSPEIWDECNRILDEQQKKVVPKSKPSLYLFTGFISCVCGERMKVPSKSKSYTCKKCKNRINIDDLETIFQEQLKSFVFSEKDIKEYFEKTDEAMKEKEKLLKSLEDESKRLREEMNQIVRLYLDHTMSQEAVGSHYRPLEERAKSIADEIPKIQAEIDFIKIEKISRDEVVYEAKDLQSHWKDMTFNEKRIIVETITEKIIVSSDEVSIHLSTLPQALNSASLVTYPLG
ncbi:MAG TPA: recombinase family protein [Candidatus Acidoferrales bacterium]|nr:recombinase family protein [Candidatus Acidoferrales bacterium]